MKKFNERLKEARKIKGESQETVSKNTKIAKGTLACYENGKRETVFKDTIIKLAKYYNVSTDWLLGLTDNPKPRK